MCSYCGCEAEPVIAVLMDDHATIASLVRDIEKCLDQGDLSSAFQCAADLEVMFRCHARTEERGLFSQLRAADEAVEEVALLEADHREILAGMSVAAGARDTGLLRQALDRLTVHAQTEDNDLFPFALQRLPNENWALIEEVHQAMLIRW